jgi:tetratricopeptide (TPR) repeat protein
MEHLFPYPKMGTSFLEILHDQLTRKLLGFDAVHAEKISFVSGVTSRLAFFLSDTSKHLAFLKIGYTALEAFLQANCTGPTLDFNPEESIFPESYRQDDLPSLKKELLESLSIDGNAVYHLTPHIELFWLAKIVMSSNVLAEAGFNGRRARIRVNFWHQKMLSEKSASLQEAIYKDAEVLEQQLTSRLAFGGAAAEEHFVEFLVERAQYRIFYGDDQEARDDLSKAAQTRHFFFALTGALGKRTKYQVNDLSQLVVLAKSRDFEPEPYSSRKGSRVDGIDSRKSSRGSITPLSRTPSIGIDTSQAFSHRPKTPTSPRPEFIHSPLASDPIKPTSIPLNDDTLLENIKFKDKDAPFSPNMTHVSESETLPTRLADLDPSDQPLLFPLDSIILLATASSIQNTSPVDGLTREETLPYATRVLEGGSSNWQVYTQALLVRSRIEGYKSRTIERGLLQLQAVVDQVITETTTSAPPAAHQQPPEPPQSPTSAPTSAPTSTPTSAPTSGKSEPAPQLRSDAVAPTTFLPKPRNASESASVAERLKYIYQLHPPLRWELEAELAARWTNIGGLKTALEIYQRLQMNAEVALCLAATDREAEATETLRYLLFVDAGNDRIDQLKAQGQGLPTDAPRLLCILGDITSVPNYYSLAWQVSNQTYTRAQRSLGKVFIKARNFEKAVEAYQLALSRGQLDHPTWFALGCVQLEMQEYSGAVESFRRCVTIEDQDAEAWSNLAVALLRLPVPSEQPEPLVAADDDEEELIIEENAIADSSASTTPGESSTIRAPSIPARPKVDPHKNKILALRALRRAATLKRDDARIWDNYLTVAASIPPSAGTPWSEIMEAMSRVLELRSQKEGEAAVDEKILEVLVAYVTSEFEYPGSEAEEENGTDAISSAEAVPTDNGDAEPFPTLPAEKKQLPYLARALLSLVDNQITPLVTSSHTLFTLLASVALWRRRPREALDLHEKAWRAVTSRPDAYASEKAWKEVVAATKILLAQYEELGEKERERTGGMVEKGWRFKARSAVRSVLGRGKEAGYEDGEDMQALQGLMEQIKG